MSSSDTEAGRKQAARGIAGGAADGAGKHGGMGDKDAPKKEASQRPAGSNARPKPSMMPRKKPD
ncbi:hypothetical protein [Nocardia goodfellowii]|uniref:General stress protein n=1 Tax=Nocardia goodfellowii TaxID=882446 RepID=A0ABS4Q754_9NOCA|nr:hypothetical protein [Nocardia goodfellowii]MBP2187530.1 hypothetical protein [Nocardia goodfellowii]